MLRRTAIAFVPMLLAALVGSPTATASRGIDAQPLPVASEWEPWGLAYVDDDLPRRMKKYGDLYRAKARMSPNGAALFVTYRLRDAAKLPRSSDAFQSAYTDIVRGKSSHTFGVLTADPRHPFAHTFTEGGDPNEGGELECAGYRVRVDYGADVLRQRIPVRCFGSPGRVRLVANVAVAYQPDEDNIYDLAVGIDWARLGRVQL